MRHVKTTSSDPALLVGLDSPDDAAVYRVAPDLAIVQTVDFFTPVVDDAHAWGRIAAANALSDVYAMGARPVTALNLVGWPRSLDFDVLGRVLEGAGETCETAGVSVVGGHSVDDPEPKFGLAVTGLVHPDRVVTKVGAGADADLVLTKPLGMGIISSAIKEGKADSDVIARAVAIMSDLNRDASEVMLEVGVRAVTDVTGFGLIGHLLQMLNAGISARLSYSQIPLLEEAVELAAQGVLPGGSKRNRESHSPAVTSRGLDDAEQALLYDAQTSGGLLMAVDPARTNVLLAELDARGVSGAAVIGRTSEGTGHVEITG